MIANGPFEDVKDSETLRRAERLQKAEQEMTAQVDAELAQLAADRKKREQQTSRT